MNAAKTPTAGVDFALRWLKAHSSPATLLGMARFAIPSSNALAVAMKDIKALGKQLGRDQELAADLWKTGIYEARMLSSFVGDASRITAEEVDSWCNDFDNWALCDALSFNLFDRTPFAWDKVDQWHYRVEEFVRRTAFALLWSLSVHARTAADAQFIKGLATIEASAADERHFVKKAVNMVLRATGKRNSVLHEAAVTVASRLAGASSPAARWVGKDALKELQSPSVLRRLNSR